MSKIALSGNPSGSGTLTIASPNTNSDRTLTLPDTSATLLTTAGGTLTGGLTMGGLLNLGSTGQIQFPATQNPSSNANTLDDYEEGTWTPVEAQGSINGAGRVYSGRYTKIGRTVTIIFHATATDTNLQVTSYVGFSGLPFTPAISDSVGAVVTEDIDVFARNGFCAAATNNRFYLSACGSAGETNQLFASTTYFV